MVLDAMSFLLSLEIFLFYNTWIESVLNDNCNGKISNYCRNLFCFLLSPLHFQAKSFSKNESIKGILISNHKINLFVNIFYEIKSRKIRLVKTFSNQKTYFGKAFVPILVQKSFSMPFVLLFF